MQECANPQCAQCHGEGEVWRYWVNREDRRLASDWGYCGECFPHSDCDFAKDQERGWVQVEAVDAFELEGQGYKWMD